MASAVHKHYSDCAQTNGSGVRLYLDTSALVKLIVAESESAALSVYVQRFAEDDLFTAALARTELVRAVADGGPPAITEARALLDSIDTVALSRSVLDDAATLLSAAEAGGQGGGGGGGGTVVPAVVSGLIAGSP